MIIKSNYNGANVVDSNFFVSIKKKKSSVLRLIQQPPNDRTCV